MMSSIHLLLLSWLLMAAQASDSTFMSVLLNEKVILTSSTNSKNDPSRRLRQQSSCFNLPTAHDPSQLLTLRREGRPDRHFRVSTPPNYDPTQPTQTMLTFHGLTGDSSEFFDDDWLQVAYDFGYTVVSPDGLGHSWHVPGSGDGLGKDGVTIEACDPFWDGGSSWECYSDTCECTTRCGWTSCADDDVQFVWDLVALILPSMLCVDHVYALGVSNGAMLTWTLGQDQRTASLFSGLAPLIGAPHYDFNTGKGTSKDLPVIGFYGNYDNVIPVGTYDEDWVENYNGYYFIPAHRMHTTWAADHGCRVARNSNLEPVHTYDAGTYDYWNREDMVCRTFCPVDEFDDTIVPFSVDCRIEMAHKMRAWNMAVALRFFNQHASRREALATPSPTKDPFPFDVFTFSPTNPPPLVAPTAFPTFAATSTPPTIFPDVEDLSANFTNITSTLDNTTELEDPTEIELDIAVSNNSSNTTTNTDTTTSALRSDEYESPNGIPLPVLISAAILLLAGLLLGSWLIQRYHMMEKKTESKNLDSESEDDRTLSTTDISSSLDYCCPYPEEGNMEVEVVYDPSSFPSSKSN